MSVQIQTLTQCVYEPSAQVGDDVLKQIPQISPQIALNSISLNQAASCGYCKGLKENHKLWVTSGFQCKLMGTQEYQMLLDRGWRRSGAYYYRPSVAKSCCQAFTIRLNTTQFQPRSFQTKVLKKMQKIKLLKLDQNNNQKDYKSRSVSSQKKIKNLDSQKEYIKNQIRDDLNKLLTWMIYQWQEISSNFQLSGDQDMYNKLIYLNLVDTLEKFSMYESKSIQFGCNYWALFYARLRKQLNTEFGLKISSFDKNDDFRQKINCMMERYEGHHYEVDINGQIFIRPEKENQFIFQKNQIQRKQEVKFKPLQPDINKVITKWVRAEFDHESFNLYSRYQKEVHCKDNASKESYISFLCQQSLQNYDIKSSQLTLQCGCWHVKYYLDGHLISVGVVDVMPCSMSSVYFFYDPDYRRYSLGVYGVLCEIDFMRHMQKNGHPQFNNYYLGFYIQDISKMNYKGDYEPSEILCPATFQWIKLDQNLKSKITLTSSKDLIAPKLPDSRVVNTIINDTNDQDYLDLIKQKSDDQHIMLEDMIVQNIDETYLAEKVRLLKGKSEFRIPNLKPTYRSYFTTLFQKFLPQIGVNLIERFLFVYN